MCLKILLSVFFAFVVLTTMPSFAHAATLSFSPPSGSYAVGGSFSASVYVSSSDQAMNAASGVISFPSDKLEVISLSKTGSIFTLWVQEPSFSNNAGVINFEGIALNPGFKGASGKLITVNFKVKAPGAVVFNFSSGSVLANDGKGTNILTSLSSAQFTLTAAVPAVPKATAPFVFSSAPPAPKISSPTHPDSTQWYARKEAKFTWLTPNDVTSARLLVGKNSFAVPTIVYSPAINEKEITNFEDGIWYFHAQLQNAGGWGETAHFKLQIDTQPPKQFAIKFINGNKTENPKLTVVFDTDDSLSGIDHYKIKIGEEDFFDVAPEIVKNKPYILPPQNPGKRSILVQAFDKAGNYATTVEEFEILPIKPPSITEYPKELKNEELLVVRGSTYPDSKATIWLQKEEEEPKSFAVQSNQDGKFSFIAEEKLKEGIYKIWAVAVNAQEARSLPTEKIIISVLPPTIFRVGNWVTGLLVMAIPLTALIALFLFIVWYGWHKFSVFRKKLKKEVREAESALHKAFDMLKEDIRDQVKLLEGTKTKRQLTEEEEKIIKQLRKNLDDAEKFVRKEIEDVEEAMK